MSNINQIIVSGRTGGEPEAHYTQDGLCICSFSLAVKGYSKKTENLTYWIDCKVFGKLGELIVERVPKGGRLIVAGELRQEKWTTKEGSNRSRIVVVGQTVEIIDWKDTGQPNDYAAAKQGNNQKPAQQSSIPPDGFDDIPF